MDLHFDCGNIQYVLACVCDTCVCVEGRESLQSHVSVDKFVFEYVVSEEDRAKAGKESLCERGAS